MNMQTPARVLRKQHCRAYFAELARGVRADAMLDRTPDDWPDDAGSYPPRAASRARKPRHPASGVVTERQNRSDATPAKTQRARRVRAARRAARRATRYARRAGVSA